MRVRRVGRDHFRRFFGNSREIARAECSYPPVRRLVLEPLEDRRLLTAPVVDLGVHAMQSDWPDSWATMEIEAKWRTTESVLETIWDDFGANDADRAFTVADTTEHYRLRVRWNGRPMRFSDTYYDDPSASLSNATHSLRHRQREQWNGVDAAPDFGDDLSVLLDYPRWVGSWQKVQYKGTPQRLGAVWMRSEFGAAQLSPQQVAATLNGETLAVHRGDDPVANAEADHPDLVWMDDLPLADRIDDFIRVVDFRYRVQFFDRDTGEERYELSLDKVRQYRQDASGDYTIYTDFYEVELEALIDGGDNPQEHSEAELDDLFQLVAWFENGYPGLEPATVSKGGNEVVDSGAYDYWGVYGWVWEDLDRDGVQDPTETGAPGAIVRLFDYTFLTVTTTVADANGFYGFRDVSPGVYSLEFVALPGTLFAPKDQGSDDTLDSDAHPATGRTEPWLLASGESADRDAGLYGSLPAARIAGLAFNDDEGDGIRAAEQTGLGDVTVSLLDGDLVEIATTTTAADGSYSFDALAPGWYCLEFTIPHGFTLSPMDRGDNDWLDSDVNRTTGRTAPFYLLTGQDDTSREAGFYSGWFSTDVWSWLRITEIMVNGPEFIELKNIGSMPLDLTDVRFIDGIDFDFRLGKRISLFPGEHVVLVEDVQQFTDAYDTAKMNLGGVYLGGLRDGGELIELAAGVNRTIQGFFFDPGWFAVTGQRQFSLTVLDETADPAAWKNRSNWRPSSLSSGSPGADDPRITLDPGAIIINEIMTNPSDGFNDWIELHNTTAEAVDIGGWYLGHDRNGARGLTNYRIEAPTVIPAGGYTVFTRQDHFGNQSDPGSKVPFELSGTGERLHLTATDFKGHLLGYSESVYFEGADTDVTFGTYGEDFVALSAPTMGYENTPPKVGPVVINEIMYQPGFLRDEFVELYNTTPDPLDVSGWTFDGIAYDLPAETVIAANGLLLAVPIAPDLFRTTYGIPAAIPIVGPYSGVLDDAADDLLLYKNDVFGRQIRVDRVNYNYQLPWPEEAGLGRASLERLSPTAYGNDPSNWEVTGVVGGTPGRPNSVIEARVVGRHIFYNNSVFDDNDVAPTRQDDAAIAPDKEALLPGSTATFANYTSYSRGINGIMVDIAGLGGAPATGDFGFKIGNDNAPGNWADAPIPTRITVRPGEGQGGSHRVTIVWADNAIRRQWLQVTVLDTPNTGLLEPDVFYFGNAVGESGNSTANAKVDAFDLLAARDNQRTFLDPAAIDFFVDYNRDAKVDVTDLLIARNNPTHFLNALSFIRVPDAGQGAGDKTVDLPALDAVFTREASLGRRDWLYQWEPIAQPSESRQQAIRFPTARETPCVFG